MALALLVACDQPRPASETPAAPAVIRQPSGDPDAIARALVAERLGVKPAEVSIVSSQARPFSDSSLDCPEPGMSYLQVITPGHVVIVEADGRRFDVRVSGKYGRICHRRKPGAPGQHEEPGPDDAVLIDQARADLAIRLGTEPDQIAVLGSAPVSAGQRLPGCVVECEPRATNCGLVVRLFSDGRYYDYLARDQRTTPCPPLETS